MKKAMQCAGYIPESPTYSCKNKYGLKRTEEQEKYHDRCDDCLRVCVRCGGVNVTETVLADANALRIIESTHEPCFCADCYALVPLVSLRTWKAGV